MRAIQKSGNVWQCKLCGRPCPDQSKPHLGKCRCEIGLGDMVASALSAVGITKERVSKALGRPCGCKKRQEALNRAGRRLGLGG